MKLFHNRSSYISLCMHNIVFSLEIMVFLLYILLFLFLLLFSRRY